MRPQARQEYLYRQYPLPSTPPSLHLPNRKSTSPHFLPHVLPHNEDVAFLQWGNSSTTLTLTVPSRPHPFCLSMENQPQYVALHGLLYIYSPQQLYAIDMCLNLYTLYALPSCSSLVCVSEEQAGVKVVYTTAGGITRKIFSPLGDKTTSHTVPHLYIDLLSPELALISTTHECQICDLSTMSPELSIALPFKQNKLTRRIKCISNRDGSFTLGVSGDGQIEIIQFALNSIQMQFTIHTQANIILDFTLLPHGLYYLCTEAIRKDPFCRYLPYAAPYHLTDVYLLQKGDSSFLTQEQYELRQLFTADYPMIVRANSLSIICQAMEALPCKNIYTSYAGEDVVIEQIEPTRTLQFTGNSLYLIDESSRRNMCSDCDEYNRAINTYAALTGSHYAALTGSHYDALTGSHYDAHQIIPLPCLNPHLIEGPYICYEPFFIARLKDIIAYLSKCINRHRLHFCPERREIREFETNAAEALHNLTNLLNCTTNANRPNAYNRHSHSTLLSRYLQKYPLDYTNDIPTNLKETLKNLLRSDPPCNFIYFLQQQPQAFIKQAIIKHHPLDQQGKFCLPLDNSSEDAYWTQLLLDDAVQTTHVVNNPRLQLLCILNSHPQTQSITKDHSQVLLRQLPQPTNAVLNSMIKQSYNRKRKGVKNSLSSRLQKEENILRALCEEFKERCQQFKVFSIDIAIERCDQSEIAQAKRGLKALLGNIEAHLKQFRTIYNQLYKEQPLRAGVHLKSKDELIMENSFVESISLLNRILSQEWIDLLKKPIADPQFILFYSEYSLFYFMLSNAQHYPKEIIRPLIQGSKYTLQRIKQIVHCNQNLSAIWGDRLSTIEI